jgi:hypothetical protein
LESGVSGAGDFKNCVLNRDDERVMAREFNQNSEFDPLKIRQRMYRGWLNNVNICSCMESGPIKIIMLSEAGYKIDNECLILWSWILRTFYPPGYTGNIRIFFIADTSLRKFPVMAGRAHTHGFSYGEIGPEHINGGYTYPCRKNHDIFIYRIEDATRVLIHELLHAFCTDRHETGVELTEAKTEAWAELIWCCFMAKGDVAKSIKNFEKQVGWVVLQNRCVLEFIGQEGVAQQKFPWRYTIAKEDIFRIWMGKKNLQQYTKYVEGKLGESLRLTNPFIIKDMNCPLV